MWHILGTALAKCFEFMTKKGSTHLTGFIFLPKRVLEFRTCEFDLIVSDEAEMKEILGVAFQ